VSPAALAYQQILERDLKPKAERSEAPFAFSLLPCFEDTLLVEFCFRLEDEMLEKKGGNGQCWSRTSDVHRVKMALYR
jgi:hypothetical protein